MHNFIISNCDTDSISFCKPDYTPFTKDEQTKLIAEINSILPPMIQMDHDGEYPKVVICRAKNYILQTPDGKIKVKGSALKASTKSPALKEFINSLIQYIVLNDNLVDSEIISLYNIYVKEILNIQDIKRWSKRITISDKTLNNTRTNEVRVKAALEGSEYVEGDRAHVFNIDKETVCLVENFKGVYDKQKLLKNLYDTSQVFDTILDTKKLFINYSLKKNQKLLEEFK